MRPTATRTLSVALVCCAVITAAAAAPRPRANPFFHSCRYRSRHWDDCLHSVAQELRPALADGIPELGVRPIDPLHVDTLNFNEASGKFKIHMQMINITMDGLRNYIMTGVRSNLAELSIELRFRVPSLMFKSYFHMDGSFLISTISGGGVCQFNFTDVDNRIVLNGHLVRRVSDDALHFRVARLRWNMLPARGSSRFSKLSGANAMQSLAATLLLNEHWEEAWSPFQTAAELAFGEVFRERINRLLMKMPYRDLFPPGIPPLHLVEHPIDDSEEDEYPPIKWSRQTSTTSTTSTTTTTTSTTTTTTTTTTPPPTTTAPPPSTSTAEPVIYTGQKDPPTVDTESEPNEVEAFSSENDPLLEPPLSQGAPEGHAFPEARDPDSRSAKESNSPVDMATEAFIVTTTGNYEKELVGSDLAFTTPRADGNSGAEPSPATTAARSEERSKGGQGADDLRLVPLQVEPVVLKDELGPPFDQKDVPTEAGVRISAFDSDFTLQAEGVPRASAEGLVGENEARETQPSQVRTEGAAERAGEFPVEHAHPDGAAERAGEFPVEHAHPEGAAERAGEFPVEHPHPEVAEECKKCTKEFSVGGLRPEEVEERAKEFPAEDIRPEGAEERAKEFHTEQALPKGAEERVGEFPVERTRPEGAEQGAQEFLPEQAEEHYGDQRSEYTVIDHEEGRQEDIVSFVDSLVPAEPEPGAPPPQVVPLAVQLVDAVGASREPTPGQDADGDEHLIAEAAPQPEPAVTEAANLTPDAEVNDTTQDSVNGVLDEEDIVPVQNGSSSEREEKRNMEVPVNSSEAPPDEPAGDIGVVLVQGYLKEAMRTIFTGASEFLSSTLGSPGETEEVGAEPESGRVRRDLPSGATAGEVRVGTELALRRQLVVSPWSRAVRPFGKEVTTLTVSTA